MATAFSRGLTVRDATKKSDVVREYRNDSAPTADDATSTNAIAKIEIIGLSWSVDEPIRRSSIGQRQNPTFEPFDALHVLMCDEAQHREAQHPE